MICCLEPHPSNVLPHLRRMPRFDEAQIYNCPDRAPVARTIRRRMWQCDDTGHLLRFTSGPIGARDNGWEIVEVIVTEVQ
jgi:hypothetical protein